MENTRKKEFEFRMAPSMPICFCVCFCLSSFFLFCFPFLGEARSRTRRRRGRDRSHNSLWVSTFHFAVCLSSLNSCCGFCLSFSFSLCFPFLRCPGLQASLAGFVGPFVFFLLCVSSFCFLMLFAVFLFTFLDF